MTRTSTVIQYATYATALLVLATSLHIGPKAWAEAQFIAETAFEHTPTRAQVAAMGGQVDY